MELPASAAVEIDLPVAGHDLRLVRQPDRAVPAQDATGVETASVNLATEIGDDPLPARRHRPGRARRGDRGRRLRV